MRVKIILFFLGLFLFFFFNSSAIQAWDDIEEFLGEDRPRQVISFLPYTICIPQDLIEWARPTLNEEQRKQGEEIVERIINKDSIEPEDRVLLGYLFLSLGQDEKALDEFQKAFFAGITDRGLLEPLLYLFAGEGDWVELSKVTRKWQDRGLPPVPLYYTLGAGEVARGNLDAASKYLGQALRHQDNHAPALLANALLFLEKGELLAGVDYAAYARENDKDQSLLILYKSLTSTLEGEHQTALLGYEKLKDLHEMPLNYRLVHLETLGQLKPEEAATLWEDSIKDGVSKEDALLNAAHCYYRSGEIQKAEDVLDRLGEVDNPVWYALQWKMAGDEEPFQAEEYLRDLMDLMGPTPEMYMALARLKEAQDEYKEALGIWNSLARVLPYRDEPSEGIRRIRQEKSYFWWLFTGMWARYEPVHLYSGSLEKQEIFPEGLFVREKELILPHPVDKDGIWVSIEGLKWEWRSSLYQLSLLEIGDHAKKHWVHIFVSPEIGGEYYRGEVVYDVEPPRGSISIKDDRRYVNTRDITLKLEARDELSGVSAYRLREGRASWTDWQTYTEEVPFALAAGDDGRRTIEVQYRDRAGNISQVYSCTVTLDREPPELRELTFYETQPYWATLEIRANQDVQVEVYVTPSWGGRGQKVTTKTYSTHHKVKVEELSPETRYDVTLVLKDRAGNVREVDGHSFRTPRDRTPPRGGITIEGGRNYINQREVQLKLWAEDEGGSPIFYSLSNDGRDWTSWRSFRENVTWELTPGDGEKIVYVRYRDESYNISSTYKDTIVLDTRAPRLTIERQIVRWDTIQLIWSSSKEVRGTVSIRGDDLERTEKVDKWDKDHSFTFSGLKPETRYSIKISAEDRAGNVSELGPFNVTTDSAPVNLALRNRGTRAQASSTYTPDEGDFSPSQAIDGKTNTYWQANRTPDKENPEWLELRFPKEEEFNNVKVLVPSTAPMTEFYLQYHKDGRWHDLVHYQEGKGSKGGSIEVIRRDIITYNVKFNKVESQRLRLLIESGGIRGRVYRPQVLEMEVYFINK